MCFSVTRSRWNRDRQMHVAFQSGEINKPLRQILYVAVVNPVVRGLTRKKRLCHHRHRPVYVFLLPHFIQTEIKA